MKPLIIVAACIVLIFIAVASCDKKLPPNKAPITNAGPDTTVYLQFCNDKNTYATLNGSADDPDNNMVSYSWIYLSGPQGITLRNPNEAIARVDFLTVGEHFFELTVTDRKGLSSKDNVQLSVKLKQHDLDIALSTPYNFYNDLQNFYYYYYYGGSYNDLVYIEDKIDHPVFGKCTFRIEQYADTTTLSDILNSNRFSIFPDIGPGQYISGDCSVNFKKLVEQGGGPFSGSFRILEGTASNCELGFYQNLSPLTLTGNIDTTTHVISLNVKGKFNF